MSKYKVEIGGFVNEFINSEVGFEDVFRHISIIVEAETEEYAKEDAEEEFYFSTEGRPLIWKRKTENEIRIETIEAEIAKLQAELETLKINNRRVAA